MHPLYLLLTSLMGQYITLNLWTEFDKACFKNSDLKSKNTFISSPIYFKQYSKHTSSSLYEQHLISTIIIVVPTVESAHKPIWVFTISRYAIYLRLRLYLLTHILLILVFAFIAYMDLWEYFALFCWQFYSLEQKPYAIFIKLYRYRVFANMPIR